MCISCCSIGIQIIVEFFCYVPVFCGRSEKKFYHIRHQALLALDTLVQEEIQAVLQTWSVFLVVEQGIPALPLPVLLVLQIPSGHMGLRGCIGLLARQVKWGHLQVSNCLTSAYMMAIFCVCTYIYFLFHLLNSLVQFFMLKILHVFSCAFLRDQIEF